jgi:hypothetical protein
VPPGLGHRARARRPAVGAGRVAGGLALRRRDRWRARAAWRFERGFGAVPELAALVADLEDEIDACARGCAVPISTDWAAAVQWNVVYWLLAAAGLLSLQNLWQAQARSSRCPTASSSRRWPRAAWPRSWSARRPSPASSRARTGGKTVIVATRVEPDLAARLSQYDVPYTRVIESTFLRDLLSWAAGAGVLRPVVLPHPADGREAGHRRLHEHRQEPRQGLRREATPA